MDVSDETMKNRLMKRGESSGRVDDNEETIKKRLETFHEVTKPVIDHYDKQGKLKRVNAERDPNAVFEDVQRILEGKETKEEEEERLRKEKERAEQEEKERKEKEKKEKEEKEKKEKERKAAEKAAEEKRKKLKEKLDKERKTKNAEAQKKLKDARVIYVTGGPASGKSTQCEKMAGEYGLTHLKTDELLQKEINSGSERGQLMSEQIQKGGVDAISKELILDVIRDAMIANLDSSEPKSPTRTGFLIDGFPHKLDQGLEFDKNVR